MIFPETVSAALAGKTVRAALLARFDCLSETVRVWGGFGSLRAGAEDWLGMGEFGSVDGLSLRSDMAAESLTFKLSGVSPRIVSLAKQSETEVKGRPSCVFVQFFNEEWQTLDEPVALRPAIMDQTRFEATGPDMRTVTMTAEDIFASRGSAPYAYYTDRDQQKRFDGDRGLEYIPSLIAKTVTWPDF